LYIHIVARVLATIDYVMITARNIIISKSDNRLHVIRIYGGKYNNFKKSDNRLHVIRSNMDPKMFFLQ
jgi:hypothetical protein